MAKSILILILLLPISYAAYCADEPCPRVNLGMNVNQVTYFTTSIPFVDLFKHSKDFSEELGQPWWPIDSVTWGTSSVQIPVGEEGYPMEIPYDPDGEGGANPALAQTTMAFNTGGKYPGGEYWSRSSPPQTAILR